MTIEGQVAAIVSIREVAINRGSNHGVKPGMVFAILAASPLAITDPETGKIIGKPDREKIRVRITEVDEKYSIGRTFEMTAGSSYLSMISSPLAGMFDVPRTKTLRVEDSDLPAPLPEEKSFVKRGDRVRQIVGGEKE